MKQVITTAILLIGFLGFSQRGEHHTDQRRAMRDFSPKQLATLETKKLTLALDLTKAQQEEVQELSLEKATERKVMAEARKEARASEETRKPSSDELYEIQSKRLDKAIAHKAKMKSILTEEQYAKWEKIMAHKGKKRRQKMSKKRKK